MGGGEVRKGMNWGASRRNGQKVVGGGHLDLILLLLQLLKLHGEEKRGEAQGRRRERDEKEGSRQGQRGDTSGMTVKRRLRCA